MDPREPGDVLYLPPGIAHWGIAEGECMTYSLGFAHRASRIWRQTGFSILYHSPTRDDCSTSGSAPRKPGRIVEGACEQAARLLDPLPSTRLDRLQALARRTSDRAEAAISMLPPDEAWSEQDLDHWLTAGGI